MDARIRQALEATYGDRCTVYRRTSAKGPDKVTRQTEAAVATNVACALSQRRNRDLSLGNESASVYNSYTLFCSPDVGVTAGDKVVVASATGQTFTLWAGRPFIYVSHAEVPLYEEERA